MAIRGRQETGKGHVVKEYKIGNTTVRICDDYCRDVTPEEAQRRYNRACEIGYRALMRQEAEEAARKAQEGLNKGNEHKRI